MSDAAWDRAALALQLLALDPFGLGGVQLRMRAGGPRETVMQALSVLGQVHRLPPNISDDQLLGGLDLTATLARGSLTRHRAYFATPKIALLPMSERCSSALAARLAQTLDKGQNACLICQDEGVDDDEAMPPALLDRLAFRIDPNTRAPDNWHVSVPAGTPAAARVTEDQIATLVGLAHSLGIDSLRAALLAVAATRAHARLMGRTQATNDDITAAAALVFAHRATRLPEDDISDDDTPAPAPAEPQNAGQSDTAECPDELLVDAVRAALPSGLLAKVKPANAGPQKGTGAGDKKTAFQRGRPLPPRAGQLDGRMRIDVIATLRAAAPWQKLRPRPRGDRLAIHTSDIRVKRFEERADRLLIFTVDASGSAAVARLGEAKGAVEMLLAEAYSSRDHVALVSFRGQAADVLLPPTRSLVQTKRRLAALPGGGGTPLAAGLNEAQRLAQQAKAQGMTPTIVLLTDGRANVALDGKTNRKTAQDDAEKLALTLRGTAGLVIDTGKRPSTQLQALSTTLDAPYLPMPRADAQSLQSAVSALLDA